MKKKLALLAGLAALAPALTGCYNNTDAVPEPGFSNGVLVLNAGNFTDNNGSVSWLSRESKTAQNDLFMTVNQRPLTGLVQGYAEVGSLGLLLVDNSSAGLDKVEIVSASTLRSVGTLRAPDIENPRQVVRISDTKAYISCYGTTGSTDFFASPGYVAVVDLTSNSVTKKITLPKGAEGITVVGNEAFVGTADYSGSKTISVIDTQTDVLKQPISVLIEVNRLELDANGKLWGISGSNVLRIDPATKAVEATLRVGPANSAKSPGNLTPTADRRSFYFTYSFYDAADNYKLKGELYRFNISDATIATTTPVVARVFSGIGFDAKSGMLYAGVTPSFKQAGYVLRYQPTGQVIDSVKVDIAPSGFWFK
jgi:hypothetical protein